MTCNRCNGCNTCNRFCLLFTLTVKEKNNEGVNNKRVTVTSVTSVTLAAQYGVCAHAILSNHFTGLREAQNERN